MKNLLFALHYFFVWNAWALQETPAQTTTLPTPSADTLGLNEFKIKFPAVQSLTTPEALHKDSIVVSILQRNAPYWQDMAVVCDWTESMYSYGVQVLYWLHHFADNEAITKWVFFNDGNDLMQGEKVVGETGGIYTYQGSNFEEVIALMQRVQEAGNGGDAPENDLEALLFAQRHFVGVKHWVLVADATSEIRDMLLLNRLARSLNTQGMQLHIILCGEPIVYDYLHLAQICNASLHTRLEDWENLGRWQEGQAIKLNGTTYTFQNGYFKKENLPSRKKNKND